MLSAAHAGIWQGVVHSPAACVFTFVLVVIFPVLAYLVYFRLNSKLGLNPGIILPRGRLLRGAFRLFAGMA